MLRTLRQSQLQSLQSLQTIEKPIPPRRTLQTHLTAIYGGLGNKLFELLSLYGIAKTLNRTAIVNVLHVSHVTHCVELFPTFPDLVQQFEFQLIPEPAIYKNNSNVYGCCKFDDPMKFINDTNEHLLLQGAYFQSYKYFNHERERIRDLLTPNSNDTKTAEETIPNENRDDFKICVHNRRGDFKSDGLHEPTHPAFARLAVDFLVKKYKKDTGAKVTVLLMSNDADFSHAVFEDRVVNLKEVSNKTTEYKQKLVITYPSNSPNYTALIISKTTPSVDLAISRSFCDVVFITAPSSTFGWWLGYLAKPTAFVYYRNIEETDDKVKDEMNQDDFFLPEWIRLGSDSMGDIVVH